MRLLKRRGYGDYRITKDLIRNFPPYAILSHTWGCDGDEVTFEDLSNNTAYSKIGYYKIQFCGEQAAKDGLQYFWVDTCCIDKSSSAELQEAINSMFQWYKKAAKSYVDLVDVTAPSSGQGWAFNESRWFTRGWTLQELIAPRSVEFFDYYGQSLGDKSSLESEISAITGIHIEALRGTKRLSDFSVEERMSWAENRVTTREEDEAYCLLGIFGVFMPMIYGEGDYARTRLYAEIERCR